MTAKPVPEHISDERLAELSSLYAGVPTHDAKAIVTALTELQHRRARGSVVAEGWVTIPIETLQWWRELVDQNPPDLAPRMDRYLKSASPSSPASGVEWCQACGSPLWGGSCPTCNNLNDLSAAIGEHP